MLKLGFTQCQAEHAVFYCYTDTDMLLISVDVDDLTMFGSMKHIMASFKWKPGREYKLKDLVELRWILTWFCLQYAKTLLMLLDPQHKLDLSQ